MLFYKRYVNNDKKKQNVKILFKFTSSKACQSSQSGYSLNGSKLYLKVPENKTGSCGIIEIFDLKSCKPIFDVSTESIDILPSM